MISSDNLIEDTHSVQFALSDFVSSHNNGIRNRHSSQLAMLVDTVTHSSKDLYVRLPAQVC